MIWPTVGYNRYGIINIYIYIGIYRDSDMVWNKLI